MQTVYADVLITVNFAMDFLSLFLTAKILSRKVYPIRLTASAFIGGIYSLFDFIVPCDAVVSTLLNIIVCVIMCRIAFDGKLIHIAVNTVVFYGICFAFGGAVTGIYAITGSKWDIDTRASGIYADISLWQVIVLSAVSFAITYFITGIRKRMKNSKSVAISFSIMNKEFKISAFADSGCKIKEPITNSDVVFVNKRVINDIFPDEMLTSPQDFGCKFCVVPVHTINSDKIYYGFYPEKIFLNDCEISAVIVFCDNIALDFYGCDAIISDDLL